MIHEPPLLSNSKGVFLFSHLKQNPCPQEAVTPHRVLQPLVTTKLLPVWGPACPGSSLSVGSHTEGRFFTFGAPGNRQMLQSSVPIPSRTYCLTLISKSLTGTTYKTYILHPIFLLIVVNLP